MSATLTIDGRAVEVAPGETVLTAARRLGLDIPTLCYLEKCGPLTSCLVCLVKINGRLVPSCGTVATPGMVVESETPEVHEARRTALELLFSDHVGDCLSPCNRICPLGLNIPLMLREVHAGRWAEAAATVAENLPLPAISGRLCSRPCEQGCRRGVLDEPAAIREVERFVADWTLGRVKEDQPPASAEIPAAAAASLRFAPPLPASSKRVAVVGAGPTGLSAAYFLRRAGHAVTVLDRHAEAGGSLRQAVADGSLPADILAAELARLAGLGVVPEPGRELGRDFTLDDLLRDHAAVVLATGESSRTQAGAWNLATTPAGLKVDADTGLTPRARVFAAGSAVRPARQVVRAMAEGRAVAHSVNEFLAGRRIARLEKPFSSIMGKVGPAEAQRFMTGPSAAPRTTPGLGPLAGFVPLEAAAEGGRCLHCDCRSAGDCQLQTYAQRYGVDASRFRGERRQFEQHVEHGEIIFEPGKCILCGICVKLCELAREPLGLTFIERGFDVRLAAPFDKTIAEGLTRVGRECVEACPTGALVFKDDWRPDAASGGGGCGLAR